MLGYLIMDDNLETVLPFQGQTPEQVEDFAKRGIAGIVLSQEFGLIEVPKGEDVVVEIKKALNNRRNNGN